MLGGIRPTSIDSAEVDKLQASRAETSTHAAAMMLEPIFPVLYVGEDEEKQLLGQITYGGMGVGLPGTRDVHPEGGRCVSEMRLEGAGRIQWGSWLWFKSRSTFQAVMKGRRSAFS